MNVTFAKGNIAWLLIVWAFYLGLGLPVGVVVPFILLIIGSILYLIAW
jgi:hypothetical protein